MPRARRAGWTVAAAGVYVPPWNTGESIRARRLDGSESTVSLSDRPSRSSIMTSSAQGADVRVGAEAAFSSPSSLNHASIPCASQNSSDPADARLALLAQPLPRPRRRRRRHRCGKLTPEAVDEAAVAPARSSAADVLLQDDHVWAPGSSCLMHQADHIPVYSSSTMTTSAVVSADNGGAGSPASTASASCNHQLRPASGGIADALMASTLERRSQDRSPSRR